MIVYKNLPAFVLLAFLAGCSSRHVPPADVVYDQPPTSFHVVKPGDSIVTIAAQYGMNKNELIRLNGLKPPYRLVKGQRLLVTKGQTSHEKPSLEPSAPTDKMPNDVSVTALPPPMGITEATPTGTERASEASSPEDEEEKPAKEEIKPSVPPPSSQKMIWPVQGKIVKDFSSTGAKRGNDGINIAAPRGTPVKACDNGIVVGAGNQLRGFGNFVLIKHEGDLISVYTHLDETAVKKGDTVQRGQKIGRVGMTGQVKESQIHFEIRKGKSRTPIDPKPFLALTLD